MKVTQYNAISLDGFIDDSKGDSSWVSSSDWKEFANFVKEKRAIIMGRKTYEAGLEMFPYDCELNVVLTKNKELIDKMKDKKGVLFIDSTPKNILKELDSKGYDECLVIGGSDVNTQFLKEGLINEIVLSIHPIFLHSGLPLYSETPKNLLLERISTKELDEGLVQVIYRTNIKIC